MLLSVNILSPDLSAIRLVPIMYSLIKVNVILKIVLTVLLTHGQAYLSFHPLSILAPQIALHRQIFNENPDQLCIILKL